MRTLITALVLTSSGALAELPTLAVSTGYTSQVFDARGFDLVNFDDAVHQFRVGAGTGFKVGFGSLDLELAFSTGGTRSVTHATVPVEFALKGLQVGVAYRVPVQSWLQPYLQLSGGYDWATLTLFSESRLTQTVGRFSGTGLLGVQLAVRLGSPKATRVPWLVFDLGAGAVLRQAPTFDAMGPTPPEKPVADAIPQATINLGTVPLSGFTARALIGVRY